MKHVTTMLAVSLTTLIVAACARAPKYAAPIPAVNDKPRALFTLSAVDTRVVSSFRISSATGRRGVRR
ncbi:hypothetical protein [Gemmatimonas sp.]|uniref:hypothetical protein n=1 Tax=Gemmatimonas sp. TaxID=1962908 RepID=UPI003DA67FCC